MSNPYTHTHQEMQERIRLRFVERYALAYADAMDVRATLQSIMDLAGWRQEQLALELGVTQATVSRWMNGSDPRGASRDRILEIYAKLTGSESAAVEPMPFGRTIGVMGRIGAGGSIDTSSEQINHFEPLFEVRVPFPVPEDALAFQVSGESMWPKYDADDIIICSRFSEHPDGVIGHIAAVETADGQRYLKRVLKGTRAGHYMLISLNASVMEDVRVRSFSSVIAVIPASQVGTINRSVKRSVDRQIATGKSARG